MIKAVLKHRNGTYLRLTGAAPGDWENVGKFLDKATVFEIGLYYHADDGTLRVSPTPTLPFGDEPDEIRRALDYQFVAVAIDRARELV